MIEADKEYQTYQRKEYVLEFIKNDVRPDNRALCQTRPAAIHLGTVSTADGSAMVKLGDTIVVCGIKAEITKPPADDQSSGVIIPNVQLPPMCSPDFRPGPPSDEAQVLSHFIQVVIDESNILDRKSLCIREGLYCWILYCDVICCNYDGNIRDATLLAATSAFKNLKLPRATYNEQDEILNVDRDNREPLALNTLPVPLSFTLFDKGVILVDPTYQEECVCRGLITIVSVADNKICKIIKQGGPALTFEQLSACITSSKQRWKEITELIEKQHNQND